MDSNDKQIHKEHKSSTSGKKKKKQARQVERHNPKAFTFSGGVNSVRKKLQHTLDLQTKREKASLIPEKIPELCPPPYIIVIQGPPSTGKSTLLKSLVKHYVKQTIDQVKGSITITCGKTRRITFIECPNNIHSMLDLAKIADLVLMTIDASFGFEMQTFEFINILQVHGFPKIMGILTHLDKLPDSRSIRRAKKSFKKRFWSELYDGAKLFYISGIQNNLYNKTEIRNLCRFISVQNFPALSFRNERPYMLVLRFEDFTENSNSTDKTVHFYGYLRGSVMRPSTYVHIPGLGDYQISNVYAFTDPCPLPENVRHKQVGNMKLRTLKRNETRMYAPFCDIKQIQCEENSVYINLPRYQHGFTKKETLDDTTSESEREEETDLPEAVQIVRNLQNADQLLKHRIDNINLALTEKSDRLLNNKHKDISDDNLDEKDDDLISALIQSTKKNRFISEEPDILPLQIENPKEIEDSIYNFEKITKRIENTKRTPDKNDAVEYLFDDDREDDDMMSAVVRPNSNLLGNITFTDQTETSEICDQLSKSQFQDPEFKLKLKEKCFITGGWDGEIESEESSLDEDDNDEAKIANLTDEKNDKMVTSPEKDKSNKPDSMLDTLQKDIQEQRQLSYKKKAEAKSKLQDAWDHIKDQAEGVLVAQYVCVVIEKIPTEWYDQVVKSKKALILGGLLHGENTEHQLLQARVKKHRWAPRVLKTNNPILFSVGWRQYQSIPLYCLEDRNSVRIRMLKYTLEHAHCLMTFYGPVVKAGIGILGLQSWQDNLKSYRISLTGTLLDINTDFKIVKKLKLVGEPSEILKNTAYIKNMFNSDLEVSKCIGARIQTVSGIRGQIKKPHKTEGVFRATFEDKISMSDIVVCKAWIQVRPIPFCNFYLDTLGWRRLRTIQEINRDLALPPPDASSTDYKSKPVPPNLRPNPVRIPKNLQRELPYKSKPKITKTASKETDIPTIGATTFEKKVATLFNRLGMISNQETRMRRAKTEQFIESKKKAQKKVDDAALEIKKARQKRKFSTSGRKTTLLMKRAKLD